MISHVSQHAVRRSSWKLKFSHRLPALCGAPHTSRSPIPKPCLQPNYSPRHMTMRCYCRDRWAPHQVLLIPSVLTCVVTTKNQGRRVSANARSAGAASDRERGTSVQDTASSPDRGASGMRQPSATLAFVLTAQIQFLATLSLVASIRARDSSLSSFAKNLRWVKRSRPLSRWNASTAARVGEQKPWMKGVCRERTERRPRSAAEIRYTSREVDGIPRSDSSKKPRQQALKARESERHVSSRCGTQWRLRQTSPTPKKFASCRSLVGLFDDNEGTLSHPFRGARAPLFLLAIIEQVGEPLATPGFRREFHSSRWQRRLGRPRRHRRAWIWRVKRNRWHQLVRFHGQLRAVRGRARGHFPDPRCLGIRRRGVLAVEGVSSCPVARYFGVNNDIFLSRLWAPLRGGCPHKPGCT